MTLRASIDAARLSGPLPRPDGATVFEFRFPADDPTFAGHFPSHPILPGIFPLEMARVAAESVLGCPLALRAIARARFLRPILPGEIVRLDLKLSEEDGSIAVRAGFVVAGQRAAEAVLRLARSA